MFEKFDGFVRCLKNSTFETGLTMKITDQTHLSSLIFHAFTFIRLFTFIMAEIKIVCKISSFIHVFKCISAKITDVLLSRTCESESICLRA